MAISSLNRRSERFVGNGSQSAFPFNFKIFDKDQVEVIVADTDGVETKLDSSLFSVTLSDDQDNTPGGTVTLMSPLATGYVLVILSSVPAVQPTVFTNRGGFFPSALNESLDRLTILSQQLEEKAERTLVVPATSEKTPQQLTEEILDVAAKANEYAEQAKQIRDEVQDRHEEIVDIRDHVDEQAAKVDAAMDDIAQAAEDAVAEIGNEAEKKVGELNETAENLKSALGVTKNDLAAELTAHASNETRIATQEIDAAKETAIANADERIANRESIAISNIGVAESAGVNSVNQARTDAVSEVGNYVSAAQQQASSAQQSAASAIQAASNAQQAASNAQSSASASAQSAQSASYSASSADSSMRSASDYASQSSTSASSSASSASKAAQSAASAEESVKTASFSVRYGQAAYANSSIQAADLVPSVNVKVGDHVINGDGELFLIDSVKNGAVHVGDVIVTLKGKDGAGLTLNGEFGSYNDLVATRPVGQPGDAYLIQGDLWYWAEDDNAWKNAGPFRGPQGERGPQGFTFTPTMASNGTLSWSNNGGLGNPISKNLTGPRGYHFTPSVNNNGDLSWTNDGSLTNPATKNIRGPQGFTFTPSVDGKGNISWSNNGNLDNPTTRNIRGYHYTPSLDGKGNLSWTNNGELENPATKNIRGYHFTPSVDGKGNLSWTNNGDLDNPATQNIRGYHYTPTVDDNGNISWTNNGELENPATKNIRGPQGFTFTPSMASDGTLSWSNNGGLANPSPQNLTGPRGFSVRDALLTEEFTAEEFWLLTDIGLGFWWKVSNASDFVVGDVACIHKAIEIEGYAQPYQITCFGVVTHTRSNEIRVEIFARVRDGVNGTDGKKGDAFEYDDFTPDQLEALKGPKGDTGPGMKSINVGSKHSSFFNVEAGKHVMFGCEEQPILLNPGDMLCAYGTMSDQEDNFAILFGEISRLAFDSDKNWQIGLYVRGHFRALRGQKGDTGATGGTGPRGYTFTPSVSSAGVLSWKNDGNLSNPSSVNIKGAKGDTGDQGPKGDPFTYSDFTQDQLDALKGKDGTNGKDGKNGATFTPSVSSSGVLSWTNDGGLANPSRVNIKGPKGDTGPAGGVTSVNGMTGAVVIDVGSGGGGSGDGIPRTGDRGVLAGFNTINSLTDPTETVVIDGLANDDTFVSVASSDVNIFFAEGEEGQTWAKHVAVMCMGGSVSFSVPDSGTVAFDNLDVSYQAGMMDSFVYVWYGSMGIVYTKNIA